MKNVKGRKEGKDEAIKGEALGHLKEGWRCEAPEKREVPTSETVDWCSLEELRKWEQAKEEKNREGKRKYTVRKRAMSEKKKWVFLYSSCISKCCNFYLI